MASVESRERGGRNGAPKYTVWRVCWREGIERCNPTVNDETDAKILCALVTEAGNRWPSRDVLRARGLAYLLAYLDGGEPAAEPAPAAPEPTYDERAEHYLTRIEKEGRINDDQPRKYRQRHRDHVSPHLGHLALSDITPELILDWQHTMLTVKGLSAKTVLNIRGETIGPIFSDAMLLGPNGEPPLITSNPLAAVRAPKRGSVARSIIDGTDESGKFLQAAYGRVSEVSKPGRVGKPSTRALGRQSAADLAMIQLVTGLRWSELAPLTVGQINRVNRTILVDRTVVKLGADEDKGLKTRWILRRHGKSDAAYRWTTYPPALDVLMDVLCGGRGKDEYLCPARSGTFWYHSAWYKHWKSILSDARSLGMDTDGLTPHGLRHSALSALVAASVDLVTLRHVAGHKSITTTVDIYGKPTKRGLADAQAALAPLAETLGGALVRAA
ncbi:tyrosine-type recombinase/integrase [Phytomonospora endophytica]|uniref:Integrase n=1 Tax=Phytomonospora endophytica TaxID=714109 RepID=A0A841FYC0_9ACTN|nr:tyrosine-type recombinase/integrase [Phytomonospora endophytica]MBB6038347.1 integrase [Phytomonospora endophytica]GIG64277.1 hypothetical protein Pen01_05720 [Phytomonospora endophytica]